MTFGLHGSYLPSFSVLFRAGFCSKTHSFKLFHKCTFLKLKEINFQKTRQSYFSFLENFNFIVARLLRIYSTWLFSWVNLSELYLKFKKIPVAAFYTNLMQCAMTAFTTLDKVIKALTFWGLWKDMSRLHAQLLILHLQRLLWGWVGGWAWEWMVWIQLTSWSECQHRELWDLHQRQFSCLVYITQGKIRQVNFFAHLWKAVVFFSEPKFSGALQEKDTFL